jgi:hypothetical protein
MSQSTFEPMPCDPKAPFRWWKAALVLLWKSPTTTIVILAINLLLQHGFTVITDRYGITLPNVLVSFCFGIFFVVLTVRWYSLLDGLVTTNQPLRHMAACWKDLGVAVLIVLVGFIVAMTLTHLIGLDGTVTHLTPDPSRIGPRPSGGPMVGTLVLVNAPFFLFVNMVFVFDLPWGQSFRLMKKYETSRGMHVNLVHDLAWILTWAFLIIGSSWVEDYLCIISGAPYLVSLVMRGLMCIIGPAYVYSAIREIFTGRKECQLRDVFFVAATPALTGGL